MTEPPGARLRVGLSGLTVAEYFRDVEGRDVLLFIDNIFRFTQAGSEVSALLGRMPSAVGYQPNLATEMGELQERITSTKKGSITSVQAIYVPADDLTDPAPATAFAHLDATTVLSRAIAEIGIYPAVDPLDSTLEDPRPARRRRGALPGRARGAERPAALQGPPGHHRDPRHGRAVGGRQAHRHARAQDPALPVAAVLRRRAVHRHARAATSRSPTPSRASSASSPARWTSTPSRRSSWSAPSTRRSRPARRCSRRVGANVADAGTLHLILVTPERKVLEESGDSVSLPATEGYVTILPAPRAADRDPRHRRAHAQERCATPRPMPSPAASSRCPTIASRCSPTKRWRRPRSTPRRRGASSTRRRPCSASRPARSRSARAASSSAPRPSSRSRPRVGGLPSAPAADSQPTDDRERAGGRGDTQLHVEGPEPEARARNPSWELDREPALVARGPFLVSDDRLPARIVVLEQREDSVLLRGRATDVEIAADAVRRADGARAVVNDPCGDTPSLVARRRCGRRAPSRAAPSRGRDRRRGSRSATAAVAGASPSPTTGRSRPHGP